MFKNRILALNDDFVYSVLAVFIMRFVSGFLFEDLIFTTSHLGGMITAVLCFSGDFHFPTRFLEMEKLDKKND